MKVNRVISHALVALQFTGICMVAFPLQPSGYWRLYFLTISLFGVVLGIITLAYNRIGNFRVYPEPKAKMRLITTGPYRFIRHPMYTSLILLLSGVSLCFNHLVNYVGLVIVFMAVFFKAKLEERLLAGRFLEYGQYQQRTCRFVPFLF